MILGIISDTHDHRLHILKAIEIFNQHQVDLILHAGDLIAPFVAKEFLKAKAERFIAVFGNNDGEKLYLKTVTEEGGGEIHEYCYKTTLQNKNIYMTHTQHNIEEIAASGAYDLVIYGHTHIQDIRKAGKTLILNPGEATDWITGKSHLVILTLDNMDYKIVPLN